MQAINDASEEQMEQAYYEILAFVQGGSPGLARLQEVLPSIYKEFGISSRCQQASVLIKAGLVPLDDRNQKNKFARKCVHVCKKAKTSMHSEPSCLSFIFVSPCVPAAIESH